MSWIVLPVVLLYLYSPGTSGHGSDHLCVQRRYWRDLMPSLESLNPEFSIECRNENDINSPSAPISKLAKQNKAAVIVQVLEEVLKLFSKPDAPWSNSKALTFLNKVSQILSDLQSCMQSPDSRSVHRSTVIERFAKLERFLKAKNRSVCAWEIVHAETRKIFQQVEQRHARK